MNAGAWERELAAYRKEFINSKGWNDKQAARYIRDAWASWRDGRLKISPATSERPSGALPVFQFRTHVAWKLPLILSFQVREEFHLQGVALVKSLSPQEQVFALIDEQGSSIPAQSKEVELKRELAQQAASNLVCSLANDELRQAGDAVYLAILAAIKFGRRQVLAEEIFR